jgi:hypothetical protein
MPKVIITSVLLDWQFGQPNGYKTEIIDQTFKGTNVIL